MCHNGLTYCEHTNEYNETEKAYQIRISGIFVHPIMAIGNTLVLFDGQKHSKHILQ